MSLYGTLRVGKAYLAETISFEVWKERGVEAWETEQGRDMGGFPPTMRDGPTTRTAQRPTHQN